jgi:hypothetical protein
MIYAACSSCGFIIDEFGKDDKAPVREKRLKYLLTRDQVCPNCLVSISKCQRVEGEENEIPVFAVSVEESAREAVRTFSKAHGYGVVTEYTLDQFKQSGGQPKGAGD